jgi:hypothetical protein
LDRHLNESKVLFKGTRLGGKRCSAATYRMTGDLRVCGLVEPLGLEWTQCIVLSRSQCGGLRSSPEPVVGGSGATRTRLGLLRRSLRAATRSAR